MKDIIIVQIRLKIINNKELVPALSWNIFPHLEKKYFSGKMVWIFNQKLVILYIVTKERRPKEIAQTGKCPMWVVALNLEFKKKLQQV